MAQTRGVLRTPRRHSRRGPEALQLTVTLAIIGVLAGLAVTLERYTYDIWGAFVWGPILILASVPLCRWAGKRTEGADVTRFLMAAAVLKIVVGALARYTSAQAFYGGLADAARYDNAGALLAPAFRRGDFDHLGHISGTRSVEIVSGLVQAVIGDTRIGTFFVFSFFGFVGLVLLYVAVCDGFPDADHRLYRRLLFLTPTMWFWPSSIGKEAVMLLFLGAATWGVVRALRGHLLGIVVAGLAIWGTLVVRPHITLVFFVGLAFALPALARHDPRVGIRRYLVPIAVVAALPFVLHQVQSFFKLDALNADTAESVLTKVEQSNEESGSKFTAPDTKTPVGFAVGVVTVTARPFPWEADSLTTLLSAIEIAGIAGVICWRITKRRRALVSALWMRVPRLALGYTLAFSAVFASVGNFGILVRQRSLLLPFLFILVLGAGPTTQEGPSRARLARGRR